MHYSKNSSSSSSQSIPETRWIGFINSCWTIPLYWSPSVCLSVCRSVSVCLFIQRYLCFSVYALWDLKRSVFVCLFVWNVCVFVSVCLSVCLSVGLTSWLPWLSGVLDVYVGFSLSVCVYVSESCVNHHSCLLTYLSSWCLPACLSIHHVHLSPNSSALCSGKCSSSEIIFYKCSLLGLSNGRFICLVNFLITPWAQ